MSIREQIEQASRRSAAGSDRDESSRESSARGRSYLSGTNTSSEKAAHANFAHQRRRDSRARPETLGAHRAEVLRRHLRRRARNGSIRRRAFAFPQQSLAAARGRAPPFRGAGDADRLRDHGGSQADGGPQAGPRSVRRQSRPERRRGRDLFGHDRRGDRGHSARDKIDRPLAGLRRARDAASTALGRHGSAGARSSPEDIAHRHSRGCAHQRQFSRVRGETSRRRRGDFARQARRRIDADRGAPRRPRHSLLLDDVPAGGFHSWRRHGPGSARRQQGFRDAASNST